MKLTIVHVGDLTDMCFNIPDYQRGYRWETKQIYELLDDLLDYDRKSAFYCMQPLVVIENQQDLLQGQKVFDVIDGQQRLTTLFLIINYLTHNTPYRLRYVRACHKDQTKNFENGEIVYDKLKSLTDTDGEIANNPDFFYLSKAIEDIESWFEEQKTKLPKVKRIIEDVIIDPKYCNREKPFYEDLSEEDINGDQKDVRFIWYDATDSAINYQSSISVFKRLNYGKTSLTAAELIKALLFQCDIYESIQKAERKQVAFRMSTEWDRMEKALKNPFMWSMLAPEKKSQISNIDFILSYIAKQLAVKNDLDIIATSDDEDYDYIVFDKYIKSRLEDGCAYADIVEELWQKIQDVFDVIMSWYNERELYHLIGLRLTLLNSKNKKFTQKMHNEYNKTLQEMFEQYESPIDMQEFKNIQKEQIGRLISIEKYNKNLQDDEKPTKLENLVYGQHDTDLVKILLAYNVTLCMKNSQDNQYFPFWFYQDITPSLEHIHPQHLHDEDIDFDIRCQWYADKRKELQGMDEAKNKEIKDACALLDKVLLLTEEEKKKEDKAFIKSYNDKKKKYEEDVTTCRSNLEKIDQLFDELATIDEYELHSIKNMALVDKNTNSVLGNGLMATKRQKLMDLQAKFNETNGEEGAYTFMGTWKIFNKQFINVNAEEKSNVKTSDLLFWSKKDRENYFADIETIYKEYVK